MKMKNFSQLAGYILLLAIAFQSCNKVKEDLTPPTEDEVNMHDPGVGVSYNGKAVILGASGSDASEILQTLDELIPNKQQAIDENTTMLIVPELSDAYEKQLLQMYEQDGVIAIINPSKANLDNWYAKHGWQECKEENEIEDALIYSFSSTHHCIVTKPDDEDIHLADDDDKAGTIGDEDDFFDHLVDDVDDEDELEDEFFSEEIDENYEFTTSFIDSNYDKMYTNLHPWITVLNEDLATEKEIESALMTRADDIPDVSTLFSSYPYGKTYPFSVDAKVRKWGVFSPDRIKGDASISVSFDIYQIHCYEDQFGAGDYYLVDMTASVANSDLYKGKWWNNHAGTYIRICGLYAKAFEIECTPVDAVTHEPLNTEKIAFTAKGFPTPSTVVGETTYDKSHTFDIGLGISISGNIKAKDGELEGGGKVGVDLSFGWSWTDSESRAISDTDISNLTKGNQVGYKLDFNNLPKYEWSSHRGFNEGNSRTYRSTVDIRSSWIWHVKDAKDDSDDPSIAIRFRAKPTYGAMSFITTKADLKKVTFTEFGNIEDYIALKPTPRDRCGAFKICNDFKNNVSIKNARLYRINKENNTEEMIWQTKSTLKPGDSIQTLAYNISDEYNVRFTTTDNREYVYSSFDVITVEQGEIKNLYTATDFTQVQ